MAKKPQPAKSTPTLHALKPTLRKLDDLTPHPKNPNTHPESQVDGLGAAFDEFGITSVIVVDEKNMILAGAGRVLAGKAKGIEALPVIEVHGWSEKKKLAFMVSDNQWARLSIWDDAVLRADVAELQLGDFNLDLIGFNADAVASLLAPPPGPTVSLSDRFGIVPFSVLNAREGIWQDRKQAWLALGIQSEVGRGENLLKFSDAVALDGKTYQDRQQQQGGVKRKANAKIAGGGGGIGATASSMNEARKKWRKPAAAANG